MFADGEVATFCGAQDEQAYRLLHNLEAYLRFMLRWEIVGANGRHWVGALGEAARSAKTRRNQEASLRWIDADERNLMSYLMLGDLSVLMKQPSLQRAFRHWPPADALDVDFRRFEALRNKSSHYRPYTARDLRNLQNFAGTVADLTQPYRQQRREAVAIGKTGQPLAEAIRPTIVTWLRRMRKKEGRWSEPVLRIVGKYVRIDLALKSGELSHDSITRFVQAVGLDCIFIAAEHPAGRLSCYVPTCLAAQDLDRLLDGLELLSAIDPSVGAFDDVIDGCEYVFLGVTDLPVPFRFE